MQLHQHKRLTRAQSHHCSDEERKRRKILARKVGGIHFIQEGTITWFSDVLTEPLVLLQKSRRSACETEEDASIRNNNSGTLSSFPKTLPGVFTVLLKHLSTHKSSVLSFVPLRNNSMCVKRSVNQFSSSAFRLWSQFPSHLPFLPHPSIRHR